VRKKVDHKELIGHPQNEFYFDRMEESKYNDFVESIRNNGLFEPLIVTINNLNVVVNEKMRLYLTWI